MEEVPVQIGDLRFVAAFRVDLAPATCAWFRSQLPFRRDLIHARWSGEACWIPLGTDRVDLGYEGATDAPQPGQFLFYPGGISEAEILLPYGASIFRCKAGGLAGNPFLTIVQNVDQLQGLGALVLQKGAQPITIG